MIATDPAPEDLLALRAITKRFGNVVALDDVTLNVRAGTVHALLGENGAGKTTLMRAAFGLVPIDSGTVNVANAADRIDSATAAIAAGLGMVHQHFTNVAAMTVAENVALGGRGRFDLSAARARVEDIGRRTGLVLDPDTRAGDLPVGAQQRLEIVKALARDTRLLILDEPTAVLAPAEAEDLMRWLRAFANAGNAVVLITHKLVEALAIADDVSVLRHGRLAWSGSAAQATIDSLAAAMLGDDTLHTSSDESSTHGAVHEGVIASIAEGEIVDERGAIVVRRATLELGRGEIVGIAAVEGAGQRELLRALAGRIRLDRGTIRLPARIGWVPEDRHQDGIILELTATENVALKNAGKRRGRIPWRALAAKTGELVRTFDVRGGGPVSPVRGLSGGNQQKLILARELDGEPELLVAENPTRGLDILAARDIRARIRTAAAEGTAVLVYSSDLDEVLALATRVLVMYRGELRDVGDDRERVGRAMLGVA